MAVGETAMSLEREILPELANQEELFGLVSSDPFVQVLWKRILNIYLKNLDQFISEISNFEVSDFIMTLTRIV